MNAPSVFKVLNIAALAALGGLGATFGYRFFRSEIAASVYRDRLDQAADDYRQLASTYNQAVRRTAVTELLVRDGTLRVRIRGLSGVLQEIPTPYDPRGEIYIDYVVVDHRLWIRRVFDARTPPEDGLIIDPRFINVEWNVEQARYGKAVYRSLTEGRWVVTVTGDGSLGLTRAEDRDAIDLQPAPPVKDYDQVVEQARGQADAITARDVWNWVTGTRSSR